MGAQQRTTKGKGRRGVPGATALRALMLESAKANRAGRAHLYESSSLSRTESPHSEALPEQHLRSAHVNDECTGGVGGWVPVRHAHPPVLRWPLGGAPWRGWRACVPHLCPTPWVNSTANSPYFANIGGRSEISRNLGQIWPKFGPNLERNQTFHQHFRATTQLRRVLMTVS